MSLFATIGDPDGTRTVTSIVGLLVAVGLALAMIAVWLFKTTRPDPELLAPLELMGERKWRRADPVGQRRTLDAVRPDGATPLTPSAAPPDLDAAFDAGPTASGFDDLHPDAEQDDVDDDQVAGVAGSLPPPMVGEPTPQQIERPGIDEFDQDIDPDVLAAATAQLEAELQRESGGD